MVVTLVAILVLLYYFGSKDFAREEVDTSNSFTATTESTTTTTKRIPSGFVSIDLNSTKIYYPSSWGVPEIKVMEENLESQTPIAWSYEGERAIFGDFETTITVGDIASYQKSEITDDTINLLGEIYESREVMPEKVYNEDVISLLPPVNARVSVYNPRYLESENGEWRGYWHLSDIGQNYNAQVHFVSALINEKEGKVISLDKRIETTKSEELQEKIESKGFQANLVYEEVKQYLKTAYAEDVEMKKAVDECLGWAKYVGS